MLVSKTRDLSSILDRPAKKLRQLCGRSGSCVRISSNEQVYISSLFYNTEGHTGYSSVRLERLFWEQEVVSSNLAIPTNFFLNACRGSSIG